MLRAYDTAVAEQDAHATKPVDVVAGSTSKHKRKHAQAREGLDEAALSDQLRSLR